MEGSLENSLLAAVSALESLNMKYAIVGGLAVSAWARPRSTRDVDLYAGIPIEFQSRLQHELEACGFHVPALADELRQFGVFRSKHHTSGVFLDIFSATGPLGESILERRRRVVLGSHQLWLISPEDLVLLKAFSDRQRDFEDLTMLFGNGPSLDQNYINRWAQMLDESVRTSEVTESITLARTKLLSKE